MKKLFTLMLFLSGFLVVSLYAQGQAQWCGNSYMFVKKGATTTWYTGSNSYMQDGGEFHGANLGTFSEDFILGGQLEVWDKQSTDAKMAYIIDDGSQVDILMPYYKDSGNNSKHQGEGTVSIDGLAPGEHTIKVWFRHTASGNSVYDSNGSNNYVATFTITEEPTVELSAPSSVFLDETITFSATVANVNNPVITYFVKVPESSEFVSASSPYQPTTIGIYTFKAEVKEGGEGDVLASDTKEVEVKAVPDDIVIKVNNSIKWEEVYLFVWGTDNDGHKLMQKDSKGWYTYTFSRLEKVDFLFTNKNDFDAEGIEKTANIENITQSACFAINRVGENGVGVDDDSVVNCEEDLTTNTEFVNLNQHITVSNNTIHAEWDGVAQVSLYSVSGQLMYNKVQNNNFNYSVDRGVYILRINDESHKVIVR